MKVYGLDVDFLLDMDLEDKQVNPSAEEERLLTEIRAADIYVQWCKDGDKKNNAYQRQLKLLDQLKELRKNEGSI